jgi:hypothetical protein
LTGHFEVPFDMQFSEPIDGDAFRGYRSLRFEFSTAEVDRANPNLEARITDPRNTVLGRPFVYLYPNTHRLSYPSAIVNEVLIPGAPLESGASFREETAATVRR